jgi:hypothetical protein
MTREAGHFANDVRRIEISLPESRLEAGPFDDGSIFRALEAGHFVRVRALRARRRLETTLQAADFVRVVAEIRRQARNA